MGLAITVGSLARILGDYPEAADGYRADFAAINVVLRKHGLPDHTEPEELPELENAAPLLSFPYSFLHYLRRVAAHARAKPGWRAAPLDRKQRVDDDALLAAEYESDDRTSHLVYHSDAEGYYVPVDFPKVLIDKRLPGACLGSSQVLARELSALAPVLGISLERNCLDLAELTRLRALVHNEGPLWIEIAVWLSLFEATRLSIEHHTAIAFA